jgi:acylphosphatase
MFTHMAGTAFTALVSGYVQGVGYRYYALRAAERLGLTGYARNLFSGEVEVVAEGAPELLRELLDELRRGPGGALVRAVNVRWGDATHAYPHFDVR